MSAETRVTADIYHGAGHVRLVPFREWRNNPSIKRFRVAADFKWAFPFLKLEDFPEIARPYDPSSARGWLHGRFRVKHGVAWEDLMRNCL
jgi:hypothetical protein